MLVTIPFNAKDGVDPRKIPATKAEILALSTDENSPFQPKQETGYYQANIPKWKEAEGLYKPHLSEITFFEPYYLASRNIQFYDETFITWGLDKVTQVYDMRKLGYNLQILPETFMVHLSHNDIKNYRAWNIGFNNGPRYSIKIKTSLDRRKEIPGLLTNTYYPSWLKRTIMCDKRDPERLNTLKEEIAFLKGEVGNYKSLLSVLVVILIFSLILLLFSSCTKNNKAIKRPRTRFSR